MSSKKSKKKVDTGKILGFFQNKKEKNKRI